MQANNYPASNFQKYLNLLNSNFLIKCQTVVKNKFSKIFKFHNLGIHLGIVCIHTGVW